MDRGATSLGSGRRSHAAALRERSDTPPSVCGLLSVATARLSGRCCAAFWHARHRGVAAGSPSRFRPALPSLLSQSNQLWLAILKLYQDCRRRKSCIICGEHNALEGFATSMQRLTKASGPFAEQSFQKWLSVIFGPSRRGSSLLQ